MGLWPLNPGPCPRFIARPRHRSSAGHTKHTKQSTKHFRQDQAGTATSVGREIDERSLSLSLATGEEPDLAVAVVDNLDNTLMSFLVEDVLVGILSGTIMDSMTERDKARFTTAKTALRRATQTLQEHPDVPREDSCEAATSLWGGARYSTEYTVHLYRPH